ASHCFGKTPPCECLLLFPPDPIHGNSFCCRCSSEAQCPSPDIQHGKEISPRKDKYTFGHHVEFQCEPGYVLRGSQRIQCWSDGTRPAPECRGESFSLYGTKLKPGPGSNITVVRFSCDEGFALHGDAESRCLADSTWHPPLPSCQPGGYQQGAEKVHYIKTAFECGVPMAEVKTLLEIQKLLLEIKKLNMEIENLNK
uniref:Sushi domain-containing protein n=1 Tax=Amazona collaria TaxID=241587 RepID=A0A8B9F3A5_9PSIT